MSAFSHIQECQVLSVDPSKRRVTVLTPSMQVVEARIGYAGPADGARVSHKALPGRGTWGIVAFPYGHNLNGVWICSIYPGFVDALTTDTDQFMDYDLHWSGAYELMDEAGRWTKSFPDGTFIQVSDTTSKPTIYRHTVDNSEVQNLTEFPDSQRIPSPPSARYFYINHASKTNVEIDPSGNTTATGATGATCTVKFGGATLVVDKNGNITGTAANGAQVQMNANNGSITIDKQGGIEGNAAPGQNIKFSIGGASTSYTLVRTDLLVNWLNSHIHTNGNAGGDTGTVVTPATVAGIQSTIANVSQ